MVIVNCYELLKFSPIIIANYRRCYEIMDATPNNQAQIDAFLDAAVDAVIVINAKGLIERFNRSAEKIFGYKDKEVLGRNINILMPSPYAEQHDGYLHNYLKTHVPKIIGIGREVKAKHKDGTIFPIDLSVGEFTHDELPYFVGFVRDLSDRARAEQEANEIRERLAHVTRLSTMGEMASGLAHEINQPLTAIANYAQASVRLLQQGSENIDDAIAALNKISRQAQRAGEVIRRLRSFVRKRDSKRELLSVQQLIVDTVQMLETDNRMINCAVNLNIFEQPAKIVADGVQIQQVILNLLRNALDATADIEHPEISISSASDVETGNTEIQIIDNGPGLPPEREAELFKPFFTTKQTGMGLGLAICQTIVNSHGGRLWFTRVSDEGGSNFRITLPLAPEEPKDN